MMTQNSSIKKKRCVGYVRSHPRCGKNDDQRTVIENWFYKHGKNSFYWGGWTNEISLPGKYGCRTHREALFIRNRRKAKYLLTSLEPGDLIAVGWLGCLAHDIDDALDGIMPFLMRRIRTYVVFDRLELDAEHLKLLRMMRREWYIDTRTNPQGVRRLGKCTTRIHKSDEVKFMRFCYRQRVMTGRTAVKVLKMVQRDWPLHPRFKTPVTEQTVEEAATAYWDILQLVYAGRAPGWVKRAMRRGYFTETLDDVRRERYKELVRVARFDRLCQPLKK